MSGVDAVNIDSLDDTVELAKTFSLKTNAIIGVSGISDIVTDGKNTAVISGGHAMMKKITGSGCMLHLLSVHLPPQIRIIFLCGICCIRFICKLRKKRIQRKNIGIATYKNNFFDEMTNPDLEGIEIEYR